MKVWLIQDILAPYRIKLFEKIAQAEGIEFRLILLARSEPTKEEWQTDERGLPFECELLEAVSVPVSNISQINISLRLLVRMFEDKPDVVICAGYSSSTMQAYLYSRITGRKFVIWMEGTETTEFNARSGIRKWQRRFLTRRAAALIDAGTQSHAYLISLLGKNTGVRFFTSFNAVDNELIEREVGAFKANTQVYEAFRSRFPEKNILFVGRLLDLKGIRELLKAYCAVVDRSLDPVGLIILGSGPLRHEIEQFAEEAGMPYVFLEGFIHQDLYPRYLAVADVVAIPSLYDRNPLVLFEAMAAGCPVVVSRHAGNAPEFVKDGENGFIVEPTDIDELAGKLLAVLNASDGEIRDMSAAALAMVKKANYDDSARAFVEAARYAVGQNG